MVPSTLGMRHESEAMKLVAYGQTDVGLEREHNEDAFVVLGEQGFFVVADGMGGHRSGDAASNLAVQTLTKRIQKADAVDEAVKYLKESIVEANDRIVEQSRTQAELRGMGTTVVSAWYHAPSQVLVIAHVGDSRCYRLRDGALELLTEDHSLLNEFKAMMPYFTEQMMRDFPKNVITRALGMHEELVIDIQRQEPKLGDVYLLCSDGLNTMLSDATLTEVLRQIDTSSFEHVERAVAELIYLANQAGGDDNVTAVVFGFSKGMNHD